MNTLRNTHLHIYIVAFPTLRRAAQTVVACLLPLDLAPVQLDCGRGRRWVDPFAHFGLMD